MTKPATKIASDGTPRAYRNRKDQTVRAATYLKAKQPNAEVIVRDLQTGPMTAIKYPQAT